MDASQIHLAFNHFPLFITLSGAVLVLLAHFRRHPLLLRAGAGFMLAGALLALPAYFSGEGAEEVVEGFAGVSKPYIEAHEDAAQFAFIIVEVLGLAALGVLFVTRKAAAYKRSLSLILLLMSFMTVVVIARTAHLGGQIRHQEVRAGVIPLTAPEAKDED